MIDLGKNIIPPTVQHVWDSINPLTEREVWNQMWEALSSPVIGSVTDSVRNSVYDPVYDPVWEVLK